MPQSFPIGREPLNFEQINMILEGDYSLELSDPARERIRSCREYLEKVLEDTDAPIYGVNTGFGALCDTQISQENLSRLQENLVRSHAAGAGEPVPPSIVQLMLLLKIQALTLGYSGVRETIVQGLIDLYNNGIWPVVYQQGSLGASGDLAPLAHLSLPLLGEGEVLYQGNQQAAPTALEQAGLDTCQLEAKEGLALLNGTQLMSAYGVWAFLNGYHLAKCADMIAALSVDAYQCKMEPFDESIQQIRAHKGQAETAYNIRHWLKDSELSQTEKNQVQDPYAFRCIPQVHGSCKQTLEHAHRILIDEINAVTDNPSIFPDEGKILSGGNFHGENLALAFDYLAMGLAEMGNISERRTYQLLCGERDLPSFLISEPGLNSGLMIPQYTAASMVSQNKQLCSPASVDSITSSQGQEDHVSMGANAATKLFPIIRNLEQILSIELFTAAQALEFRRPAQTSPALEQAISDYRQKVPFVEQDRAYYNDIRETVQFIRSLNLTL